MLGGPETITITIEREQQTVLSDTVTPAYRDEEINGDVCGTCRQGTALVELDGSLRRRLRAPSGPRS